MITGFFNIPWFGWAAVAFVIAVIYTFVWPRMVVTVPSGFHFFILRGVSPNLNGVATLFALAGGAMHLLFITMAYGVQR